MFSREWPAYTVDQLHLYKRPMTIILDRYWQAAKRSTSLTVIHTGSNISDSLTNKLFPKYEVIKETINKEMSDVHQLMGRRYLSHGHRSGVQVPNEITTSNHWFAKACERHHYDLILNHYYQPTRPIHRFPQARNWVILIVAIQQLNMLVNQLCQSHWGK